MNPYTLVRQAGNPLSVRYYRREGSMSVSGVPTEESVSVDLMNYTWEQGKFSKTDGKTEEASNLDIRCTEYIACGKKIKIKAKFSVSTTTVVGFYFYDYAKNYLRYRDYWGYSTESEPEVNAPNGARFVRITISCLYGDDTISPAALTSASAQILRSRALSGYKSDVEARGASGITPPLKILNAQIADTGLYTAGVDYDLGDTVYLETARGVRGAAKITAITEVEDAEGYRIYPTFSDWTTL